jgi:hypothetical protein
MCGAQSRSQSIGRRDADGYCVRDADGHRHRFAVSLAIGDRLADTHADTHADAHDISLGLDNALAAVVAARIRPARDRGGTVLAGATLLTRRLCELTRLPEVTPRVRGSTLARALAGRNSAQGRGS